MTERGKRQAVLAAAYLGSSGGRVVTSPSPRARETADALAGDSDVTVVPELLGLQLDSGDEGPLDALEQMVTIFQSPEARPFGGESLADLAERSVPRVLDLARDGAGGSVVSHRIVNVLVVGECLGWDRPVAVALQQDTGAVNLIEWVDGRFDVAGMNLRPDDPLLVGPLGCLPDTNTPIERRIYAHVPGEAVLDVPATGAERAAVVGERAVIRGLFCDLLGLAPSAFDRARFDPGSVSIADYAAGRWWVRTLNYCGASGASSSGR